MAQTTEGKVKLKVEDEGGGEGKGSKSEYTFLMESCHSYKA